MYILVGIGGLDMGIIYVSFPVNGGGVCFRKYSGFQRTHENVGVGRCHLCTHGSALFLDVKFIVKSENIFVENEFQNFLDNWLEDTKGPCFSIFQWPEV